MDLRATLWPYASATRPPQSLLESLQAEEPRLIAQLLEACALPDLALAVLERSRDLGSAPGGARIDTHSKTNAREGSPVSLYIPCYNGAHFLREILPAALNQSYPVSKVLVVDDGSTDDTASVAESMGAIVIRHSENRGLAAARNTAIGWATDPFLACLDADVAPDRYWLERLMPFFENKTVAGVGGRLVEQHTLTVADRWRARMMAQHYGVNPVSKQPVFGCNGVFRLEVLKALGGYNEAYTRSYEDIDLSKRLLQAGHETRYHPEALCRHQRKDSPEQVVATCFQWRLPHLQTLGFAQSGTSFGGALGTNLKHDLKEIEELYSTGDGVLSYPSLLMLLESPLRVTELTAESMPTLQGRALKDLATALSVRILAKLQLPSLVKEKLATDLMAFFTARRYSSLPVQDSTPRSARELVRDLAVEETPFTLALGSVLESIPDVTRFRPQILAGLEQSALECACDEQQLTSKIPTLALDLRGEEKCSEPLQGLSPGSIVLRGNASAHLSFEWRERVAGADAENFLVLSGPGQEALGVWWRLFLAGARPSASCTVRFSEQSAVVSQIRTSALFEIALNGSKTAWEA